MVKIAIILGTRPEIIKLASIIRYCQSKNLDYFIIHTNQHYSPELDKIFFEELELPNAKYHLNVGSHSHGKQTGLMLERIEKILITDKPNIVLVEGDTNSVLAGALAASKLHIPIGHVEAGLRSYDHFMPEEINRIITDKISDFLFAPTEKSANILKKEGFPQETIYITGNTIVDAVYQHADLAEKKSSILNKLSLKEKEYFLATLHRAENVDHQERLKIIIDSLNNLAKQKPIILPLHPRTKKMMQNFNLKFAQNIVVTEPLGYLDFLSLEKNTALIITDSGGVQEEACILGVPCVTMRDNTERPETVEVGANCIATIKEGAIEKAAEKMLNTTKSWQNPFGDGNAGKKIVDIVLRPQLL